MEKANMSQSDNEEYDYYSPNNTIRNLCVICGVDMGPDNPRQLCRKTYCENEDEILLTPPLSPQPSQTPPTPQAPVKPQNPDPHVHSDNAPVISLSQLAEFAYGDNSSQEEDEFTREDLELIDQIIEHGQHLLCNEELNGV